MPVLLLGALVLLLGLGLWALSPGDGSRPDTAADQTESASPSETEDGSTEPSPSETPEASAEEMEAFVDDYLSTVTSDPRTTWEWLTPEFQDASGNYGSYRGFWSTIESAELLEVEADPDAMTVSYTVEYTTTDGGVETDDVTLELVKEGDQYLIAGES